VDDLPNVARIARGRIELRRAGVDLREVVMRAADDFRLLFDDRGVAFRTVLPDTGVPVDVDGTRMTQAIGNLLHNAAKFTRRGDEVVLSLAVEQGMAEIRVRDSGVGIDPALLPRIFDIFVQGDRTLARTEGGLGLGLALVKGITELHGGTARAESGGIGKGSEFAVRLPLVAMTIAPEEQEEHVEPRQPGRKVLIVDDNQDAAESLADIVRMLGHSVDVAYDGASALEKARANPPSIVLCDIGASGHDGIRRRKGAARPEHPRAAARCGQRLRPAGGRAASHRGGLRPSRCEALRPRADRASSGVSHSQMSTLSSVKTTLPIDPPAWPECTCHNNRQ